MIKVSKDNPVWCWFSGGITSAVACHLALDIYGKENCRLIFIDTKNEDEDTYRFLSDCEKLFGVSIEFVSSEKYDSVQDTWFKHKSLNVAHGAICSYMLKRKVRERMEKTDSFSHQIFGFEFGKKEINRAKGLLLNHSHTNAVFPLIEKQMDKTDCIEYFNERDIDIPRAYKLGFQNNNCLKTGCVQGGIGYWQKMAKDFPEKFEAMAKVEHKLTDLKGVPVTMLKDQTKTKDNLLFLKAHSDYPENKTIFDKDKQEVQPLVDCVQPGRPLCGPRANLWPHHLRG